MRGLASTAAVLLAASGCGIVGAQTTTEDVNVDLQPCILAKVAVAKDTLGVTEAYLFNELFKGAWASSQYTFIAPGETALDLTVDDFHGRCNVIFVGIVPSAVQYAQLTAYSQRFQVRIVYFDEALTADDADVMAKLGLGQYFAEPLLNIPGIKLTDAATPRVVNSALQTDPLSTNIFTRPVRQISAAVNGTLEIVADYADASGTSLSVTEGTITYPSAAIVTYKGDSGEEEMHIFFGMAWFDVGSWAWGHYVAEWGTKGVFSGERRFWLGAMVDDLFLASEAFEYNGDDNIGEMVRMTGDDLTSCLTATAAMNSEYNSEMVVEFNFNSLGMLEQVNSTYVLDFPDADAALLPKGELPTDNGDGTVGLDPILPTTWYSQETIDGLKEEFESGLWDTDTLLMATISSMDDLYLQSHTVSHLARDNLGVSDCETEDGGNTRIAVLIGVFDSDNYDWRSMTTPGITGLFNKNCLASSTSNLMTCAPGDNTYDGVQTTVSLVSSESQFQSIYTTEATNGYAGYQIVPRFATFLYYNCHTTDCLILENLYIRRVTCGCSDVDPGTIDNLNTDTTGCDTTTACPSGLLALETVENFFNTEATTTARWVLTGRRDKYMFHQANGVPTTVPSGTMSLLEYWFEVVLAKMAGYLNLQGADPFPLRSVKFDDLCTNFAQHGDLDNSGSLVTMTKTAAGSISGMTLSATGTAGVIPVTVPTSMVGDVSTTGLPTGQPYSTEEYGSDTTFYVATSVADEPPAVTKPTESDLPTVPESSATVAPTSATAGPTLATISPSPAPGTGTVPPASSTVPPTPVPGGVTMPPVASTPSPDDTKPTTPSTPSPVDTKPTALSTPSPVDDTEPTAPSTPAPVDDSKPTEPCDDPSAVSNTDADDDCSDSGDDASADSGDDASADSGDDASADSGEDASADSGDDASADSGDDSSDSDDQRKPHRGSGHRKDSDDDCSDSDDDCSDAHGRKPHRGSGHRKDSDDDCSDSDDDWSDSHRQKSHRGPGHRKGSDDDCSDSDDESGRHSKSGHHGHSDDR